MPKLRTPQKDSDEPNVESRRLTAPQIFEAVSENAREELKRPWRALAFSGLAGGPLRRK